MPVETEYPFVRSPHRHLLGLSILGSDQAATRHNPLASSHFNCVVALLERSLRKLTHYRFLGAGHGGNPVRQSSIRTHCRETWAPESGPTDAFGDCWGNDCSRLLLKG